MEVNPCHLNITPLLRIFFQRTKQFKSLMIILKYPSIDSLIQSVLIQQFDSGINNLFYVFPVIRQIISYL